MRTVGPHGYEMYGGEEKPGLIAEAGRIAGSLGLDLVVRHDGYGDLERRLVAIMDGREQPGAGAEPTPYAYPFAATPPPRGRLPVRRIGSA